MINYNEDEIKIIIDNYFNGLKLINEKFKSTFFFDLNIEEQNQEKEFNFIQEIGKKSYLNNPDLFYTLFQYGVSQNFKWNTEELVKYRRLEPKIFIQELLIKSYPNSDIIKEVNDKLKLSLQKQLLLNDNQLKEKASKLFFIKDTTLLTGKKKIIYTKINHGYWEQLLNSFIEIKDNPLFRDLSNSSYPKSLADSGFHAVLFEIFNSILKNDETTKYLKIGISLSAGDRLYEKSISSKLTESGRGALVGLNAFIKSLLLQNRIILFEGSVPRDMIKKNYFKDFFDIQLNMHDAILLIVPPSLKHLEFPKYNGKIYCITMPAQFIHENFRVLIPFIMGTISTILSKHTNISIITQSAALAPLIGTYIYKIFEEELNNISFYDLGRILDIANSDIIKNYPSLSWVLENNLQSEILNSICINNKQNNFSLLNDNIINL